MMRLRLAGEDKREMAKLIRKMGDIIARNNDRGLELDLSYWAAEHFNIRIGEEVETRTQRLI